MDALAAVPEIGWILVVVVLALPAVASVVQAVLNRGSNLPVEVQVTSALSESLSKLPTESDARAALDAELEGYVRSSLSARLTRKPYVMHGGVRAVIRYVLGTIVVVLTLAFAGVIGIVIASGLLEDAFMIGVAVICLLGYGYWGLYLAYGIFTGSIERKWSEMRDLN